MVQQWPLSDSCPAAQYRLKMQCQTLAFNVDVHVSALTHTGGQRRTDTDTETEEELGGM